MPRVQRIHDIVTSCTVCINQIHPCDSDNAQTVSLAHLGSTSAGLTALESGTSQPLAWTQLGNCGLASVASRMLARRESSPKGLSGRFRAKSRFVDADARILRQCQPRTACRTYLFYGGQIIQHQLYISGASTGHTQQCTHTSVVPQQEEDGRKDQDAEQKAHGSAGTVRQRIGERDVIVMA